MTEGRCETCPRSFHYDVERNRISPPHICFPSDPCSMSNMRTRCTIRETANLTLASQQYFRRHKKNAALADGSLPSLMKSEPRNKRRLHPRSFCRISLRHLAAQVPMSYIERSCH